MALQHWSGAIIATVLALACITCALRRALSGRKKNAAYNACSATPSSSGSPFRRPRRPSLPILPDEDPRWHEFVSLRLDELEEQRPAARSRPAASPEPEPEQEPELAIVVYHERSQAAEPSEICFTESTTNLSISEHDPGLVHVRTLAAVGTLGRQVACPSVHGCVGVAVVRGGYPPPRANEMAANGRGGARGGDPGESVYCAEFVLEEGDAEGAVVGLMRSSFEISGATTGASADTHTHTHTHTPHHTHTQSAAFGSSLNLHVAAGCFFPTDTMGWGYGLSDGALWHRGRRGHEWVSSSHWASDPHLTSQSALGGQVGDRIRLTLDMRDSGTLTVHKNDLRLGVLARDLLVGDGSGFCWMVQLSSVGQGVRIRDPRRRHTSTRLDTSRGLGIGNSSNASWHAASPRR